MAERYWLLAPAQDNEYGSLPPVQTVVSIPWWTEVAKWQHSEGKEFVAAPLLFTDRQLAETHLHEFEAEEPDSHLRLNEEHGEEVLNRAWENTAPMHVFSMDREWLLDLLEDSDFLCVMVDGRLKLRQDLIVELSTDA